MDLKVPSGISLRFAGTITVRLGLPNFLNFTWLPLWEIKIKPLLARTFKTIRNGYGLGILKFHRGDDGIFHFRFFRQRHILKI